MCCSIQHPELSNQLEAFLERFVGRLIEIASADVDDKVALNAVLCLRKAYRYLTI